jgi:hypothetical protein
MSEESGGSSIIGKFFVALGLKIDDAGISKFKSQVEHLTHSVEALGVAFGIELIRSVGEFVERSVGAAAAVQDFSEVTGMSAEKVAALGRVAVENSSSMEAMQGAIMGISRAVGMSAMGIGRHVKLFQQLGIAVKDSSGHVKTADQVMSELADKFKGMDVTKRNAIAGRLGIDPLIAKAMADAGSAGWRAQVHNAMGKGLLDAKDYEQAERTEKTFRRFHILTGQLTTLVANQLGPWIQRLVTSTEKWLTANKVAIIKRIHEGGQKLAEVLGRVWEWGEKIWSVMTKLEGALGRTNLAWTAMKFMLVAVAGLKFYETINSFASAVNNLWLAMTKIPIKAAAIGLVMLAVGLLVEDFIAWQNGEESVLKDLSEEWPTAIKAITGALNLMLGVWQDIVQAARDLGILKAKAAPDMSTPEGQAARANFLQNMSAAPMAIAGQLPQMRGGAAVSLEQASLLQLMNAKGAQGSGGSTSSMMDAATGVQMGLLQLMAAKAGGDTAYISGNTVVVQADTPQRAKEAGTSVREALSTQKIRNYQPRTR